MYSVDTPATTWGFWAISKYPTIRTMSLSSTVLFPFFFQACSFITSLLSMKEDQAAAGADGMQARLLSLYARFKSSPLRLDFPDEENLAMLAAIPLVQAFMQSCSSFTEEELFRLIFRFNRPLLASAAEEESTAIPRAFTEAELLEVATGLALRAGRRRYREARAMMAHLGGPQNAPPLSFFLAHDQAFVVLPRPAAASQQREEKKKEEEQEEQEEEEELEKEGGESNPFVLLRTNVRHAITDKTSAVAALRTVIEESRDHRLTLLVLRQRFERDCGVPFGCAGFGSLTSFLRKQRGVFHVQESRKKKTTKSAVTLVDSSKIPSRQPRRHTKHT